MHYLFELGCDELPASFLSHVEAELTERLKCALEKARIAFSDITIYLAPRRLAFQVSGIAATQTENDVVIKGPPVSVGLDKDGNPTQAALGFAKKVGIAVEKLKPTLIDGTEYLATTQREKARPTQDVLPEILPDVILGLSGNHFMRWEKGSNIAFSRPIRWIVSLLEREVVPVQIASIKAGNQTRGHRFLAQDAQIHIPSATQYLETLKAKGFVYANHQERAALIETILKDQAKQQNADAGDQTELIEHVNFLVEHPIGILGQFDTSYLKLPESVITTVMSSHQKYFHLVSLQSQKLLPAFVAIGNNTEANAQDIVRSGNEKVLRARLEDAAFFFTEDRKKPLAEFVPNLEGITFQKGLGSLLDKTNRLEALVELLSSKVLNWDAEATQKVKRAAHLSKADLGTLMVRELTELQGEIGEVYATESGENTEVASAIREQYYPRFLGDKLPSTNTGLLLSLADKLDTLVAAFSQPDLRLPTGSKDPMGLRRLCFGILNIILQEGSSFNQFPLRKALQLSTEGLGSLAKLPVDDVCEKVEQFILQRYRGVLLEEGYRYDLIDAVFECDAHPLENLSMTTARLNALKHLLAEPNKLKVFYEPGNRIHKILSKNYQPNTTLDVVSVDKLENDAERVLYDLVKTMPSLDIEAKLSMLASWETPISTFFDKTLVNAEDESIRANRYKLLSILNQQYQSLCNWTKLVC